MTEKVYNSYAVSFVCYKAVENANKMTLGIGYCNVQSAVNARKPAYVAVGRGCCE